MICQDKYRKFEAFKKDLRKDNLPPSVYEQRVKDYAKKHRL